MNGGVFNVNHNGIIYTEKEQPTNIKYLKVQTYASPDKYTLYGNTQHNNFECDPGKDCIMYGGGGADEFYQKIQQEIFYLRDFKQNENDADKIYLPKDYSDIKATQSSDNKISITAEYTFESRRGETTKYVNIVLEDTHWSLGKVQGWVDVAKSNTILDPRDQQKTPIIINNNL